MVPLVYLNWTKAAFVSNICVALKVSANAYPSPSLSRFWKHLTSRTLAYEMHLGPHLSDSTGRQKSPFHRAAAKRMLQYKHGSTVILFADIWSI